MRKNSNKKAAQTATRNPAAYQLAPIVGAIHFPDGSVKVWEHEAQGTHTTEAEYKALVALRNWESAARVPSDRAHFLAMEVVSEICRDARDANEGNRALLAGSTVRHKLTPQEVKAFRVVGAFQERLTEEILTDIMAEMTGGPPPSC